MGLTIFAPTVLRFTSVILNDSLPPLFNPLAKSESVSQSGVSIARVERLLGESFKSGPSST